VRSAIAVAVGVVACTHTKPQPAIKRQPTAQEVLDTAAKTYANAASYADRGTHTTVFRSSAGRWTRVLTFATAFARTGDYRFEFYSEGDPSKFYVAWRDGLGVHARSSTRPDEKQVSSLMLAIAAATGISSGTAHTIPNLLMPGEIGGRSLTWLRDLELDPHAAFVDGHTCWKLSSASERTVLWVDRETHLVRRIATTRDHSGSDGVPAFSTQETTTYDPTLSTSREAFARHPEAVPQPPPPPWIGLHFDRHAHGARVIGIVSDGPAARAGILSGDEIVAIDGKAMPTPGAVVSRIQAAKVGARVVATISRAGQTLDIPITLEARPDLRKLGHTKLINQRAPDFDLPVVANGGSAKLSDLAGDVIVIDFWATWCKPCERLIPQLEALHQKYAARGLRVLGISDDDAADITLYAQKHSISYPLARDADAAISHAYWQAAWPMLVVIDRAGVVRAVDPELFNFEAKLADLLK
jgi:peroxiredoxin